MKTKICVSLFCFVFTAAAAQAQLGAITKPFTKADTLRGSITPERAWWDALHYSILVTPDFDNKSITVKTDIRFKVTASGKRMQIDLQEPMELTKAYYKDQNLPYTRVGNVYYIDFPKALAKGTVGTISLAAKGNPKVAKRAPWDGGWIFKKDEKGRPWMSVACQGLGASVWYPCKDHQSDEPDQGAVLAMTVPDTLSAIGNGRLIEKKSFSPGTMTWRWQVKNPINIYNLVPYIGKYVNWSEPYQGEKGKLDCDYWVLDYELDKAKEQFKQAPIMLKCFEHWFGPYPFYEDGYKLVQSPHLGMEHQSAVAYGNGFQNGYLGRDLSGTGHGLKWDFIIVHESGHEWFANNITSKDLADMWIHEGFTNFSETLFTECQQGKQAGDAYNYGARRGIRNDVPIIAPYGVNKQGSGDMYPKASAMLQSIRNAVNDDEKFRNLLRLLNKKYYHQTVTTEDIQATMSSFLGLKLNKIFDQYLRTTQIPVFEYSISDDKTKLSYRWANCVPGFNLPVYVQSDKGILFLDPDSEKWNTKELKPGEPVPYKFDSIEKKYYVTVKEIKN